MKKMNATHCGLGLLVLGILGITVSCGGTDDSADGNNGGTNGAGTSSGGSAGSSASAGRSTAGSSSNGGSNNNSAGDGPGNQGGNDFGNNGGRDFGFGGNPFNFGGAGPGNDPDCPATAPADGADCQSDGQGALFCRYDQSQCGCLQNNWTCQVTPECPAEEPADGTACTGFNFCPYGGNSFCICGQNEEWNCPGQ